MTDHNTTIREAQEALARLDKADEEIGEVAANGNARWRMSIPADPNRDTDLIVSDACVAGQRAITALLAVIEQQAETLRQVREYALAHAESAGHPELGGAESQIGRDILRILDAGGEQ